jgi:hypothetical protein
LKKPKAVAEPESIVVTLVLALERLARSIS